MDQTNSGGARTSPRRAGMRRLWVVTLLLACGAVALLIGQDARADDSEALKAESPYFAVRGAPPGVDALPLKGTKVDVKVLGPIADVTVVQQYRNEGTQPISANYVFPGSTHAAVHAMNVRLGDRVLTAQIREKQAARIEFEQAKRDGKTATLLEQQRPNVFQMSVANILPGDDVRVELHYTELLTPRDGRYEFVFPTVVGPRYNSPSGEAAREKWVATPHLHEGEIAPAPFDIAVTLATPLAAKDVVSPSHPIEVRRGNDRDAPDRNVTVRLAGDGRAAANRDFILRYALAGDRIESGLLLSRGEKPGDENFFLAMVEPPKAVPAAAIVPREYIFVVDISGSMHGFPLDTAKVMLDRLLKTLRPNDSFNVLLFSGSARTLARASVPATQANIDAATEMLAQQMGNGGTEIVPALRQIAAMPKRPDISRNVVVITDGFVTVEREVFQLVRNQLGNANVFAFGIGSSVNRALMEGIARAGQGESFIITRPDQAQAQAERFRRMIDAPVLTQVQARFEGLQVYDVEPAQLPDVLGGRPVIVFGKWKGEPQGRLVVEGRNANGLQRQELAVADAVSRDASALRNLWARERIDALSDEEALNGGNAQKEAITALGLRYALLTSYTSFIAVDQRVRTTVASTNVDQPLPLPEGVSDNAVGTALPSTPEPEAWAAAIVMLALLGWLLRDRPESARKHTLGDKRDPKHEGA